MGLQTQRKQQHKQPEYGYINNRLVTVRRDCGWAERARLVTDERMPDADITLPIKGKPGWVKDIIFLCTLAAIVLTILSLLA